MRLCMGKLPRWTTGWLALCLGLIVVGCHDGGEARSIAKAAAVMDIEALSAAMKSPTKTARCYAANAIARLRHENARALYLELLKISDCGWKVPTEAAFRLSEVGFRDELPAVRRLLESSDIRHQVSAALVLADANDVDALPLITPLLSTTVDDQGKPWLNWAVCRLEKRSNCVKPKTIIPSDEGAAENM
ncbi:MAG: HEAT repeat domain-containing protein [Myxococcales bacterium]|nr:HEAT repeat domain-containing protein [Myxococcales bacterium]